MKLKNLVLIISLCLTIFLVSCECVLSRPVYSFSDDVFSELPVFPEDFFDIKSLYDTQRINATRLGDEYLQPELLTNWMFFANKTYGEGVQMGSYGIFCYPSHFSVGNMSKGDSIILSTLIYAMWGIHFYQGTDLIFNHTSGVNVTLLKPTSSVILLSPTYPKFLVGWMQVLQFRVDIDKTGEHLISLFNCKPSSVVDDEFRSIYDGLYVSGMGLLSSETPCLRIHVYPPVPVAESGIPLSYYFSLFIVFVIIGFIYAAVRFNARQYRKEED